MTYIEHDNAKTVFQELHSVDVMLGLRICRPVGVYGRGEVQNYHTADILLVIVEERLNQDTTVCFIDVTQKVTCNHDFYPLPCNFSRKDSGLGSRGEC